MAASETDSETQTEKHPSITSWSFELAVKELISQYKEKENVSQCIKKAVCLDEMPSYDEFFTKYLVTNQLCILSEKATKYWRSRRDWVGQDGLPNFDFLHKTFGKTTVPVADCRHTEFSSHAKENMMFSEFLDYWKNFQEAGHPSEEKCLYLKDWHFKRYFPDYEAYKTSIFFRSDWMNEYWDMRNDSDDDYRFVYMGPKGTWTPFHADVFRSFSWSANICGRKRWIFFPPGEEEYLKDVHGNLAYDVTSKDLADSTIFPNVHKVRNRIELIQHPGETIFVPSGWYHQVENLEDTISINHNWLNGCNVRLCWYHLKASLADVQNEISDCMDMEGWDLQCQKILKAVTGLDFCEFFRFMQTIARNRIRALHLWLYKTFNQRNSRKEQEKETCMQTLNEQMDEHVSCQRLASLSCKEQCGLLYDGELQSLRPRLSVGNQEKIVQNDGTPASKFDRGFLEQKEVGEIVTCQRAMWRSTCILNLHCDRQGSLAANNDRAVLVTSLLSLRPNSSTASCTHWSRCNVYHALFDLVSVTLVLKDMSKTPEMISALLGSLVEKTRFGHDGVNPEKMKDILEEVAVEVKFDSNQGMVDRSFHFCSVHESEMITVEEGRSELEHEKSTTKPDLNDSEYNCNCGLCRDTVRISSCEDLLREVLRTLIQFSIDVP